MTPEEIAFLHSGDEAFRGAFVTRDTAHVLVELSDLEPRTLARVTCHVRGLAPFGSIDVQYFAESRRAWVMSRARPVELDAAARVTAKQMLAIRAKNDEQAAASAARARASMILTRLHPCLVDEAIARSLSEEHPSAESMGRAIDTLEGRADAVRKAQLAMASGSWFWRKTFVPAKPPGQDIERGVHADVHSYAAMWIRLLGNADGWATSGIDLQPARDEVAAVFEGSHERRGCFSEEDQLGWRTFCGARGKLRLVIALAERDGLGRWLVCCGRPSFSPLLQIERVPHGADYAVNRGQALWRDLGSLELQPSLAALRATSLHVDPAGGSLDFPAEPGGLAQGVKLLARVASAMETFPFRSR